MKNLLLNDIVRVVKSKAFQIFQRRGAETQR